MASQELVGNSLEGQARPLFLIELEWIQEPDIRAEGHSQCAEQRGYSITVLKAFRELLWHHVHLEDDIQILDTSKCPSSNGVELWIGYVAGSSWLRDWPGWACGWQGLEPTQDVEEIWKGLAGVWSETIG